jgi:4'-phosphopantetheinyl transferase
VCSIAPAGVEVGVDLELVEPRSRAFVEDYFTPRERRLAVSEEAVDPVFANLVWSAKESALKVLRTGLRRATQSVEVDLGGASDGDWAPLRVAGTGIAIAFEGWWRRFGPFLLTVVADAPTDQPVSLRAVPALADAEPVHSWLEAPGPVDAG